MYDAVDLFAVAGGEADAPTFFVFSDILYYPGVFVNGFFQNFLHIFCGGGETMVVPEVQRVQKMEVYLMDNTKNTKNTKNTNTIDNTENTNTKNAKNAKNCK